MWGAVLSLGPAQITTEKIFYLFGIVIGLGLSLTNLYLNSHLNFDAQKLRSLCSILIYAILLYIFNFLTAMYGNFDFITIFRQLMPIFIFIAGFFIMIECGIFLSTKKILINILVLGVFSAMATFIKWSQLYGALKFNFEDIGFGGDFNGLLALIVLLSTYKSNFRYFRKILWMFLIVTIVLFFSLSFSRTYLVLMPLILLFSTLVNSENRIKRTQLVAIYAFMSFLILQLVLLVSGLGNSSTFLNRYVKSLDLLSIGGLGLNGLGSDPSIVMRKRQGQDALIQWHEHIFFGTGILSPDLTFDHIFATLASNGLIGITLLSMLLIKLLSLSMKWKNKNILSRRIIIQYMLLLVSYSFIGNWPTNKSAWMALLFILGLLVSESKEIPQITQNKSKFQLQSTI